MAVEPGPAFDAAQWSQVEAPIETLLHTAPAKIGRHIAFSGHRVAGSWRGERSQVQILPLPAGAPTIQVETGEHPFILEFPFHANEDVGVMKLRLFREHRRLARDGNPPRLRATLSVARLARCARRGPP